VLHTFIRSRLGARNRAIATANGPSRSARGQSLVEFALVLPMLLVLLLGLVDFGRVFTAGIAVEATARNAAEAAAQEYQQIIRNKPGTPPLLDPGDYQAIHQTALKVVCREADTLPNQAKVAPPAETCTMPVTAVCVHDVAAADPYCGLDASSPPSECSVVDDWSSPSAANEAPLPPDPADEPLAYVEVRVCYQFTTLINISDLELPFGWGLSLGDVWLQRDRQFVVGNY
jgi:hypothetical protein